jgi:hypothetical protein
MMQDDVRFHSERAMAELDSALRAANAPSARAHFTLSALHFQRIRTLSETLKPPFTLQP